MWDIIMTVVFWINVVNALLCVYAFTRTEVVERQIYYSAQFNYSLLWAALFAHILWG